jgi:hypothetical protein
VTRARRYVAGVGAVGAAGLVAAALVPAASRPGLFWGLIVGLLLQAPLGWWTLRAMGTERFLPVWGLGMLVRLAVVAVAAFALMAAPETLAVPMLAMMVAVLMALLLVEGAVAWRDNAGER